MRPRPPRRGHFFLSFDFVQADSIILAENDPFLSPDGIEPFHVRRIFREMCVVCLDGLALGAQSFGHQAPPKGAVEKEDPGLRQQPVSYHRPSPR